MAHRDPLDDLDELLFDQSPAPVLPHLVSAVHAEPAHALAEVPAAHAVVDASELPLKQRAERLSSKMLAALESQFDRGELDADDLMVALPKVHRVKIDEEKVEIQRGGGDDNLPVIHINIGYGEVRAEPMLNRCSEVVESVETVAAKQPPAALPTWLGPEGFSIDLQPIDGGGES